ncbi:MAG: signal recognition particle protein [Dehalococcoidia bacterium]|jgi:signal recognition particle subunit SRP54|nr:signal recognition particle protein [Dehalococcoidia bacterium]
MFEVLSQKLGSVFSRLSSKGRLTERDIDEALREVRLALLEADVHFKVVKDFIAQVRERSLEAQVLESLTPAQQVVKIVNEELIAILGEGPSPLAQASHPPTMVMLVGLQGSGKTTTAAKLALHLKSSGQRPLLVAADLRRPAAIEQLVVLGNQLDIPIYREDISSKPVSICAHSLKRAAELACAWVIADTGGRLHIDEAMMEEVARMKRELKPSEVLLVVDAMTGQDAVRAAEEFHAKMGLTGLILTKMDGDARGGAALSIKTVTGVPIKFIGTGEKTDAFETFHPDRLASRILGMGDMLTLVEKAEKTFDAEQAKKLEKKLRHATLDLEDFLLQLEQMQKMGPLSQLVEMIPGLSAIARRGPIEMDEGKIKKIEAIILSMTPEERRNPDIIDGHRKRRIARGSGTTPQDVNQLLNQFRQTQKLVRQMTRGRGLLDMLR